MSKQFKLGLVLRLIVLACMCVATWAAVERIFWLVYMLSSVSVVGIICFIGDEFKRDIEQ